MKHIGIGICTYNRLKLLKSVISRIQKTGPPSYTLFVADDGSTDGTRTYVESLNIECVSGPNQGIAKNKNKILHRFRDYQFIFIIEDDLELKKSGWHKLFITAHELSGIHHFTFSPPGPYGSCVMTSNYPSGCIIEHTEQDGGAFAFYTKEVIDVCGGFHPDFVGYGWEHCEFSERIHRAGLTRSHRINHVRGSRNYMKLMINTERTLSADVIKSYQDRNKKVWLESRAKRLIKCPLE